MAEQDQGGEGNFHSEGSAAFSDVIKELADREAGAESAPKPRIFLEVGFGPSPSSTDTEREFYGADHYVGVDLNEYPYGGRSSFTEAKEAVLEKGKQDQNIDFVKANGNNLPFADGSVHEVLMSDVMYGDLSIQQRRSRTHPEPFTSREIQDQLLAEAYRALESGGKLVIKNESIHIDDKESLEKKLSAHGFELETYLEHTKWVTNEDGSRSTAINHEFNALEKIYGARGSGGNDFYMIATKKPEVVVEKSDKTKKRWFRK